MEYTDISDAILDGTLDTKLESLQEDINTRVKLLARKRAAAAESLSAGTRVRLHHVTPKAAEGATGVITYDTHNGKIGIRLDYSINGRLRQGESYTWPASCYVKLDDNA